MAVLFPVMALNIKDDGDNPRGRALTRRAPHPSVPTVQQTRPMAGRPRRTTRALGGPYSPSLRSGVRSSGSASSISFVKIRSERL